MTVSGAEEDLDLEGKLVDFLQFVDFKLSHVVNRRIEYGHGRNLGEVERFEAVSGSCISFVREVRRAIV